MKSFALASADAARLCAFDGERGEEPALPERSYGELRALACGVAAALGSSGTALPALLLCEDRFYFAAALLGALEAGVSVTLPPSRGTASLGALGSSHVTLHDGTAPLASGTLLDVRALERDLAPGARALAPIDPEREVVTLYTSGSQGEPVAWHKRARQIFGEAELLSRELGLLPDERVLGTVPAQHIYGLLFALLAPLAAGASFARRTPLHGPSIVALSRSAAVTRLVSVPAHYEVIAETLDALGDGSLAPGFRGGVSSGARLAPALAKRLSVLGLDVVDVLGSTETGGIALRRPAQSERYTPLSGVVVRTDEHERLVIRSPFLENPERDHQAGDRAKIFEDGGFEHLGRGDDVVKIGGKRVALGEIEAECLRLPGVRAVAALRHDVGGLRGQEIWLAAVAPGYSPELLRAALRTRLDAVLVPRRVRVTDELPIDERGKLRRARLLELFTSKGSRDVVHEKSRARGENEVRTHFEVPVSSPRYDGHFIGDPLLPALAQLHDLVLPVIRSEWPELVRLERMSRVKFTSPIRPGSRVQMNLTKRGDRVDFDLLVAGSSSARGCLHFGTGARGQGSSEGRGSAEGEVRS